MARKLSCLCPRCNGVNVQKNGVKANGRQRLLCPDCNYEWLKPLGYQKPLDTTKDKECPKCGSHILNSNGGIEGIPRKRCVECGYQWLIRPPKLRTGPACFQCGIPTRKAGKQRGKERCSCPDCNKYWMKHKLEALLNSHKFYWED